LRALVFLAPVLRAEDFRAVDLRPVDLRVDFLAPVLRAEDFLAVDFLAVDLVLVLRLAAPFLAAVLRLVVVLLRVAAAFFAAADLFAEVRFLVAAAFFAAVLREVLLVVAMCSPPLAAQDAMRFRRRRSRSLIPPHTPYRSSRRSA
jgi:hypothetical protein